MAETLENQDNMAQGGGGTSATSAKTREAPAASSAVEPQDDSGELLTKEQFEKAFRERLARERRRLEQKLAEKYADYEKLLKDSQELAKLRDAQKTEQEKMLEQFERIKAQLAELQGENARLAQERTEAMLRAAVVAKATTMGFHDPDDAYRMIDLAAVTIDEDGAIEGIEDQLQAIVEAKPYLVRGNEQGRSPRVSPSAPGHGAPHGESDEDRRQRLFGLGGSPLGKGPGGGIVLPQ